MTEKEQKEDPVVPCTVYENDGRIVSSGTIVESWLELQARPGQHVLKAKSDPFKQYVKNGQVMDRPNNPTVLDGMVLRHVPAQATITINRATYQAESDTITLDFTYPGKYRVLVSAFPYLDAEFVLQT